MARTVRRLGQQEIPDGEYRPESETDEDRLRGSVLQSPLRPEDTAGGDATGTGGHRTGRQGAVCGHIQLAAGGAATGLRLPEGARRAAADLSGTAEHAGP